jgi:hypothetical protein
LVGQVMEIEPQFEQAQSLQANLDTESRALESSLHNAEALMSSQRFDEALAATAPYRSFSEEEPRIAAIAKATYKFHFDQGTAFLDAQKWQEAVTEFQRASEVNKTLEAAASLRKAETGLEASQSRRAADLALAKSQGFADDRDYIDAYEVLVALPKGARQLVSERIQELEPDYIKAASEKAKTLQLAHTPIRGKADEVGVLRAYDLLQSAHGLSEDDKSLKLRLDLLSDTLSDYYLQQAKRYLEKPLGSGIGLAWLYLDQSQLFKPNRDDVRDEKTKSAAVYQMRSKLSLRVVFRDQTSRRDSAGFADQMSDAIATGVARSGLPIKVVKSTDSSGAEANFQLAGDVLQRRAVETPTVEALDSKYRSGEREVPNEEWNKVNRDYEAASLDLQKAQRVLEEARSRGKKKEIADAETAVTEAESRARDVRRKLDSLTKTNQIDVIKPYTYIKRTIDLEAIVELAFRLLDSNGDTIEPMSPINKSNRKTIIMLENVKPEDTEGVKPQGTLPDEVQFLADVENDARNTLINAVLEKVRGLPEKILTQARRHAQDGDLDGAAESYILYLNATPEGQTPERAEAEKFLQSEFHARRLASSSS